MVATDWVEVSVFGRGGPVVVSGGYAAVAVVEPREVSSTAGLRAEVGVVLSVGEGGADEEVLS